VIDVLQQLRGVQSLESPLGHQHSLIQMTAVAFSTFLKRFAASVRSRKAPKRDSIGLLVRRWTQWSFGNW
jgi:hypothetical protein